VFVCPQKIQVLLSQEGEISLCNQSVRSKKVHSLAKICVASGFFESSVTNEAVALTSVVDEKGAQDYLKLAGVRRAVWL